MCGPGLNLLKACEYNTENRLQAAKFNMSAQWLNVVVIQQDISGLCGACVPSQ